MKNENRVLIDKQRGCADKQTPGVVQPGNRNEQINLINQNTRTLMQALHGCRKNCTECREEETEWEEENYNEI